MNLFQVLFNKIYIKFYLYLVLFHLPWMHFEKLRLGKFHKILDKIKLNIDQVLLQYKYILIVNKDFDYS